MTIYKTSNMQHAIIIIRIPRERVRDDEQRHNINMCCLISPRQQPPRHVISSHSRPPTFSLPGALRNSVKVHRHTHSTECP